MTEKEYLNSPTVMDRFWSRVDKSGPTIDPTIGNCWIWLGTAFPSGYPRFSVCRIPRRAHRISFFYENGKFPLIGRHKCDMKMCCRPSHILDGTHTDNVQDRVIRNRSARGEHHGNSKLTESQVAQILKDDRSERKIAKDFCISSTQVHDIKHRRWWKHVEVSIA
jgi:hypothetical protein